MTRIRSSRPQHTRFVISALPRSVGLRPPSRPKQAFSGSVDLILGGSLGRGIAVWCPLSRRLVSGGTLLGTHPGSGGIGPSQRRLPSDGGPQGRRRGPAGRHRPGSRARRCAAPIATPRLHNARRAGGHRSPTAATGCGDGSRGPRRRHVRSPERSRHDVVPHEGFAGDGQRPWLPCLVSKPCRQVCRSETRGNERAPGVRLATRSRELALRLRVPDRRASMIPHPRQEIATPELRRRRA